MNIKRRTFLAAVPSFLTTAAIAQVPNAPTSLMIAGAEPPPPPPPPIGGDSSLADLAESLSPGEWGQLNSVTGQDATIGSQSGSSGSAITFGNSQPWNPHNQSIEIMGADHLGGADYWIEHSRYSASTNSFSVIHPRGFLSGIGHVYDHLSVNPHNGDVYFVPYTGFTGSIPLYRKPFGGGSYSQIFTFSPISDQATHGSAWWSGAFDGAGSHGCFVLYDNGNGSGQLRCYDPLSASQIYSNDNSAPGSGGDDYHTVVEYSPIHNVAVYGGGKANASRLWRLSSDGSVTSMPNSPMQIGMQDANLVNDPVSGNFVLMGSGQIWELNPTGSGSWRRMGSVPGGVGDPTALDAVVSSAITDFGVIAYITQVTSSGGTFFLYKHA